MLNVKKNVTFNITEDNAEDFAIIPTRECEQIMRVASQAASHLILLQDLMKTAGFDAHCMKNYVKTLADIPAFKKPE